MKDSNDLNIISEPLIEYARALRKHSTKAEKLLWKKLKNRKLNGLKFRRQHPISTYYILDFYCDDKKLAIELDGAYHLKPLQKMYDEERTNHLEVINIKVLRFMNAEVINDIKSVLQRILNACE